MQLIPEKQIQSGAILTGTAPISNRRGAGVARRESVGTTWGRTSAQLYSGAVSSIIFALSLPFAVLARPRVQRFLLAIIVLNVPFHVSKHFFRHDAAADFGAVGGLDISLSTMAMALLYLAWLVSPRSESHSPRQGRNYALLPVALLLVCYALSLLVAHDATLGLFQVWTLLQACLLYFYVSNKVTSREDLLFIVRWLLIGLILEDAFMLAQAGGLVGDLGGWGLKAKVEYAGTSRLSGTIVSANLAAGYLAMMMAVALVIPLSKIRSAYKYLAIAALILSTVPLVLTLSRSGWMSLCVSVIFIAAFRGRIPWKAVLGVLAVVTLLAVPFGRVISDRLTADDNGAAASRGPLDKVALSIIEAHPIMGVGANNFPLVMNSYAARDGLIGEFLYTVHNVFLLIWSETGIGGLLAFVWFLAATFWQGWRCWKAAEPLFSPIAVACMAAMAGQIAQMSVDVFREGATYESFWLLAGLTCALYRLTKAPRHVGDHSIKLASI